MIPAAHRGAALITVLWLVAGLTLMIAASTRSVATAVRVAALEIDRLRAEAVLDGAWALMAQHLRRDASGPSQYRLYRLQLGGDLVEIEVTPANGLIDVNVAAEEVLRHFLIAVGGTSPEEAVILTARIRDWVDPDDEPSGVSGAESSQYRTAGWPTVPRNERMDDAADLLGVLGMTPVIYEKIEPFLGFYGRDRINIDAAPPELIDRMAGREGEGARWHALPPEQRSPYLAASPLSAWFYLGSGVELRVERLRMRFTDAAGHRWQRLVWIDRAERPDTLTPWTTLVIEPTQTLPNPIPQPRVVPDDRNDSAGSRPLFVD